MSTKQKKEYPKLEKSFSRKSNTHFICTYYKKFDHFANACPIKYDVKLRDKYVRYPKTKYILNPSGLKAWVPKIK